MFGSGAVICTLKNTSKVVSLSIRDGLLRVLIFFFRRILRGGSWGGTAEGCRVSYIDYDIENYSDEYGGFRLVMEPESIK